MTRPKRRALGGFLVALALAAPVEAENLEISASLEGGSEAQEPVAVTLVAESQDRPPHETVRSTLEVPGRALLDLPLGVWELRLEAPEWWSEAEVVLVSSGGSDVVDLVLWRTGWVVANVGERPILDHHLTVSFRPEHGSGRSRPSGRIECGVDQGSGEARCRAPVGTHELRLGLLDHVPHYFFDRTVSASSVLHLGRVQFERGSSVSGWVETRDAHSIGDRTRVVALPGDGKDFGGLRRVRIQNAGAPVRENGFFQMTGIPEGQVAIHAESHPSAGSRDAVVRKSPPIDVVLVRNRESQLRHPLILETPQRLAVVVEPATDRNGQPWHILVAAKAPLGETMIPVVEEEVPVSGYWESGGLAAGLYVARVTSPAGDESGYAEVDLGGDPMPVVIELGGIGVEGEVLLGDDPVAATVWFGGRNGAEKVTARASEDGRFATFLPRTGAWLVEVEAEDPPIQTRIPALAVEAPDRGRIAHVEIHLPDTKIEGRVLDEEGRGVRALVNAVPGEDRRMIQQRTDEDGRFEIRGITEGLVSIDAVARHPTSAQMVLTSDRRILTLSEDLEPAPVELTLRSQIPLRGRVVSSAGPVPAAHLVAVSRPTTAHDNPPVQADADGVFQTGVPPGARFVSLTVTAPGYPLTSQLVPIDEDGSHTVVRLGRASGTLEILEPEGVLHETYDALYQGEAEVSSAVLRHWARLHGRVETARDGYLVAPHMAPGSYRLCRQVDPWSGVTAERAATRCVEGYLAPDAVLALEIPDER